MKYDMTRGGIFKNLIRFSLPYLLSCFLQTFYGLADLFITGRYNGADAITAVSVGSQLTHMLTVVIVGLAMGTTVSIGRALGAGKKEDISRIVGNTITLFAGVSLFLIAVLTLFLENVLSLLSTPAEAMLQAKQYLFVCVLGIPFIAAYNVISNIFRGLGDSKTPMYFVAVAGVVNVILDIILIGPLGMGAKGAAIATVTAQGISVALALIVMRKMKTGITLCVSDLKTDINVIKDLVSIGSPIAAQDGFIQVSFLVITAIANSRGVEVAAAVGIVEKLICFIFLVPSAMLSSVSAIAAQNAGAGRHDRSRKVLFYGIGICIGFGIAVAIVCQFAAEPILTLFAKEEPEVVRLGAQYLRAYIVDCGLAGIHFCFTGFFCAYEKSFFSFLHNMISILAVRIPGAYLASVFFPDTLFPMGLAAPAGSLLSVFICLGLYLVFFKNRKGSL